MSEKPPLDLDPSDPTHAAVLDRLKGDTIAWFTTVRDTGAPHAVPVWFLWHRDRAVVMCEPDTVKVRNVRRGSPVLLHLHTRDDGDGVVILTGWAEVSERPSSAWWPEIADAYTAKYEAGMAAIGLTPEAMTAQYSALVEVVPTGLKTW